MPGQRLQLADVPGERGSLPVLQVGVQGQSNSPVGGDVGGLAVVIAGDEVPEQEDAAGTARRQGSAPGGVVIGMPVVPPRRDTPESGAPREQRPQAVLQLA